MSPDLSEANVMEVVIMNLEHLTAAHVNSVVAACDALQAEYVTADSGIVERSPNSTAETYKAATSNLSAALQAVPDQAMIELQALVWTGRGDNEANFAENLDYSKTKLDSTSRDYLASKGPLKQYIEKGLSASGAVLSGD